MSWSDQLISRSSLRDIDTWPQPDLTRLDSKKLEQYRIRRNLINQILTGTAISKVAQENDLSPQELYRLLDRCLGSRAGAQPSLFLGLVPDARLVDYSRQQSTDGDQEGFSGAFSALIARVPAVFKELEDVIEAAVAGTNDAQHLSARAFNTHFRRLLTRAGLTDTEYPFNTRKKAAETLRKWRDRTEYEIRCAIAARKSSQVSLGYAQVEVLGKRAATPP